MQLSETSSEETNPLILSGLRYSVKQSNFQYFPFPSCLTLKVCLSFKAAPG